MPDPSNLAMAKPVTVAPEVLLALALAGDERAFAALFDAQQVLCFEREAEHRGPNQRLFRHDLSSELHPNRPHLSHGLPMGPPRR
jgi:hypothetical protein